ncbi:MAG: phosphoribosylformylglycinamidine cyclo-ligase [Verrucomicrobiota bacterium]|nr:phosphoribosylformylglycinamidine cyclo-ligase [Verrucomicrobiota bacterium]
MKTNDKATKTSAAPIASSAYAQAGVDIDAKMSGIDRVKQMINKTATRGVLSRIGTFGGLFASPGEGKVLVASTDGVGTKLKVAVMANRHDTVGQDIVNHCVNDILVQGARPLFFMDYVGASKFDKGVFEQIVSGLCKACRENGCALLGGETAEMPGLYPPGEYDLVGAIVGVADRKRIVVGKDARPGDMLIGLPSGGLQTNGYSLARKVFFETAGMKIHDKFPGTHKTVADVLLAVHRSFLRPVTKVMKRVIVRGMAHITGGGFPDNVVRSLPDDAYAVIDRSAWTVPRVFTFIQERGQVGRDEMYRVFNMGIGFVLIVREKDARRALSSLRREQCDARLIGYVAEGKRRVVLQN